MAFYLGLLRTGDSEICRAANASYLFFDQR